MRKMRSFPESPRGAYSKCVGLCCCDITPALARPPDRAPTPQPPEQPNTKPDTKPDEKPVAGEEDQALAGLVSATLMGPRTIGAKAAAWITHLGRGPHTELTFARGKHCAALHGFSLYAGPRIDPCSTHRIEKLTRHIVSPPIEGQQEFL